MDVEVHIVVGIVGVATSVARSTTGVWTPPEMTAFVAFYPLTPHQRHLCPFMRDSKCPRFISPSNGPSIQHPHRIVQEKLVRNKPKRKKPNKNPRAVDAISDSVIADGATHLVNTTVHQMTLTSSDNEAGESKTS